MTPHAPEIDAISRGSMSKRLEEMAAAMQAHIDQRRGPRLENTPKRQREGMSARIDADNYERAQYAMRVCAAAWRDGTLPPELRILKRKAEFVSLMRFKIISNGYYHVGTTGEFADESPQGVALQCFVASRKSDDRAAEEAERERERRLREALASVSGRGIAGYFPTPPAVCIELLGFADIQPEHRVFEPSAGDGAIAQVIRDAHPEAAAHMYLNEVNPRLCEIIKLRGFDPNYVTCADFLECDAVRDFDRIVMNPPFENGQDCAHVMHAFGLLANGGRVVSVMSPGFKYRENGIHAKFRSWLEQPDKVAEVFDLPPDSFKASGTSVGTVIVVIDKEAAL